MTAIKDLLGAEFATEITTQVLGREVPLCECEAGVGGFVTLPGTTLAVHECGRPKPAAFRMFPSQYLAALRVHGDDVALIAKLDGLEPANVIPAGGLAERPVTVINGVEVDLDSEALHEAACVDCGEPRLVEVKPKGVSIETLIETPREVVCESCIKDRMRKAIADQREVEIVRQHTPKKENSMRIDLHNISDAELGRIFRRHLMEHEIESLPLRVDEARKAEIEAEAQALQARAEVQAQRTAPLPGFVVNARVSVPALDMSDHDRNTLTDAQARKAYNQARHAFGEHPLDKDTTTWGVLESEHLRLMAMVAEPKAEPEVQVVAAPVDNLSAKVTTYMQVTGITDEALARQLVLASLNA